MESVSANLLRGGFYLFVDLIIVSLMGWAFWFIVSKLTTPAEIGLATTTMSLVGLVGGFFGLGLEYPLLREVAAGARSAFGTILTFETLLLGLLAPALYVVGLSIYGADFAPYMALGVALLLISGVGFVARSTALAVLQSRKVLLYDATATATRFGVGIGLVWLGLGGLGILWASLIHGAIIGLALFLLAHAKLGLAYGGLAELVRLLKIGLSNLPSRAATLVPGSLSIVLLAAFTSNPGAVGLFFIALAISSVATGLASSLATMALPVSSASGVDTSTLSLRLGLAVTVPVLAALVAAPSFLLSLLGPAYVEAAPSLRILAVAALPLIVLGNVVARLNHLRMLKPLTTLGLIQVGAFLVLFLLLTGSLQAVGAALAILLSTAIASGYTIKWLGRTSLRSILIAILTLGTGGLLATTASALPPFLLFPLTLAVGVGIILATRELAWREATHLLRVLISGA